MEGQFRDESTLPGRSMPGTWSTIDIAGHPAEYFEPSSGCDSGLGAIYLHSSGLESLAEQAVFTAALECAKLPCISPRGNLSWWTGRRFPEFDRQLTPESYLVEHVRPFLMARCRITLGRVGVFGIGMGGQGALRLAFKYPDQFPVVAAIAAAIDFHELYGEGTALDEMYTSKEQCRQDTAPLHVHPAHYPSSIFFCIDPADQQWFRGNDRLHEKLAALGVPHQADLLTQAGGHGWGYFNHMAERVIHFLQQGLSGQTRRLL
jgi:S-formylglutathione hydrolase